MLSKFILIAACVLLCQTANAQPSSTPTGRDELVEILVKHGNNADGIPNGKSTTKNTKKDSSRPKPTEGALRRLLNR